MPMITFHGRETTLTHLAQKANTVCHAPVDENDDRQGPIKIEIVKPLRVINYNKKNEEKHTITRRHMHNYMQIQERRYKVFDN